MIQYLFHSYSQMVNTLKKYWIELMQYKQIIISILLFFVIPLFYYLCLIDFPFPIVISSDINSLFSRLENRIRDMVTSTTISLTVIVFSVNAIRSLNLPNEKFNELLKDSYLIPLITFLITNTICAIIISYMYETLKQNNFMALLRLISLTYYFLIGNLVFITFTFIRVYRLTNLDYLIRRDIKRYFRDKRKSKDYIQTFEDIITMSNIAIKNNDVKFLNKILSLFYYYESKYEHSN